MKCIVVFTALFTELNRCILAANKVQVKAEESADDHGENACQDIRSHDEVSVFVIETLRIGHCAT